MSTFIFATMVRCLLFVFGVFITACSNTGNTCEIDYINFKNPDKAPPIYIVSKSGDCEYDINADFWVEGRRILSSGQILFSDGAFFMRLREFGNSSIKVFDLLREKGEGYAVPFKMKDQSQLTLFVTLDDVIYRSQGATTYLFRFKDAFVFEGNTKDFVLFVTKENGIVGSYISGFHEGVELVIAERGDILRNDIDYSKKKFWTIE